ncbi:MAG: hypothetical protein IPM29_00870 [Planctomycetes bacterium]|nr:hypothetical protein [Planctomycetota bacterium]
MPGHCPIRIELSFVVAPTLGVVEELQRASLGIQRTGDVVDRRQRVRERGKALRVLDAAASARHPGIVDGAEGIAAFGDREVARSVRQSESGAPGHYGRAAVELRLHVLEARRQRERSLRSTGRGSTWATANLLAHDGR